MIEALALAAAVAGAAPAYFPDDLLQPRMICDAMRPTERLPVLSAHDAERYGSFLVAAAEPALALGSAKIAGDILRFTWLRSFDTPIIIRVERRGKTAHLVATRLTGQGSHGAGAVKDRIERDLSAEETARLRAAMADNDLDQLPSRQCEPSSGEAGAVWLFEHADRKIYHLVERRTAEASPVRDLGLLLLDLAGWSDEKIY